MELSWEFMINFLETLIFFYYINKKNPTKDHLKHANIAKAVLVIGMTSVLTVMNHININTNATIIIYSVINLLFCLFIYNTSFISTFFQIVLFNVYTIFADILTVFVPIYIFKVDLNQALAGGTLRIPCTLLYIALLIFFVYVTVLFSDKQIFFNLTEKVIFLLISIFYISFAEYFLTLTIQFYNNYDQSTTSLFLTAGCVLIIASFLLLLFYIYRLGCARYNNIQYLKKEQLYESEKREYENLIKTTDQLRKLKHDFSLHLDVIKTLASSQKYEELNDYLVKYTTDISKANTLITTGNSAIDALITTNIREATQLGISFRHIVHLPDKLPFDNLYFASLLGNILKNALEECKRIKDTSQDLYISLSIKPYQNMLIIQASNSSSGEYNYNNARRLISKKKSENHGFGLKRIEEIADLVSGYVEIYPEQHSFTINVILPLTNGE